MNDLAYKLGKRAAADPNAITQALKSVARTGAEIPTTTGLMNTVGTIIKDLNTDRSTLLKQVARLLKQRKMMAAIGIPGALAGVGGAYYLGRRSGKKG